MICFLDTCRCFLDVVGLLVFWAGLEESALVASFADMEYMDHIVTFTQMKSSICTCH